MNLLGKKLNHKINAIGKKLEFAHYLGNKIMTHKKNIQQAFQPDEHDKKPISPLEKKI